jgi:malto-oligosyltrehalose trehalohydrolase
VRYAHGLPFGTEVTESGTRFTLWAPSAQSIDLVIDHPVPHGGENTDIVPAEFRLKPDREGFARSEVIPVGPGTLYRYRINNELLVPDPASRAQQHDVHGPSQVVDPRDYEWQQSNWRGRRWEETVLYELHVGTFTAAGTFRAAMEQLDHLADLGVTAVELMPIADFPGERNWGYDGVLPFAPDASYGTPNDLKRLVDACHARGLMAFLDVVYNHFGPEGNYLGAYAAPFFTDAFDTPWGAAIDFSRRPVRDFFVHNALYWLEEYRFDGLRFDAVHAILDPSDRHILTEIAERVRATVDPDRHVHLVLENDHNNARFLATRELYDAQWDDDFHHTAHTLVTGEEQGYYMDFAAAPVSNLARSLGEGFVYQGEPSPFRDGQNRGEPSGHLPPSAFVHFIQNHDQIGNRAFGDRLTETVDPQTLELAIAVQCLTPHIPMLFMGEEWATQRPFRFFCDFGEELAAAVREGRRREFASFPEFRDPKARERIPDPNDPQTCAACRLDWEAAASEAGQARLALYRELLQIRREHLQQPARNIRAERLGAYALTAVYALDDGCTWHLWANFGADEVEIAIPEDTELLAVLPRGPGANGTARGRSMLPARSLYVGHSEG